MPLTKWLEITNSHAQCKNLLKGIQKLFSNLAGMSSLFVRSSNSHYKSRRSNIDKCKSKIFCIHITSASFFDLLCMICYCFLQFLLHEMHREGNVSF